MPVSPLSTRTIANSSPSPAVPPNQVKKTGAPVPEDKFYEVPLTAPSNPKHSPLAVDDTNVTMPQYFGLARLEETFSAGAVSGDQILRKDAALRGVPANALQIMEAICKTNSEPLYAPAPRFVMHKRKGFPPTMKALGAAEALIELKQGGHIKITLAHVAAKVVPGQRNLVTVKPHAEWTYRLDSYEALSNWWTSFGWAHQVGSLR